MCGWCVIGLLAVDVLYIYIYICVCVCEREGYRKLGTDVSHL